MQAPFQTAAITTWEHSRKFGNKFSFLHKARQRHRRQIPSGSSVAIVIYSCCVSATRNLRSGFTSLMFPWTSITEWLHPAAPPVKTLPFFGKYFHSAIIASICSNTMATLAVSLQLSEFTAKWVANVSARRSKAYSAVINREETEIWETCWVGTTRGVWWSGTCLL